MVRRPYRRYTVEYVTTGAPAPTASHRKIWSGSTLRRTEVTAASAAQACWRAALRCGGSKHRTVGRAL
ncbi:hypothetical protein [uncultured Lamprocystis sp.]|jgi:hypothetical protein|uniref:hypothetical protein n=1 Tax=uncultured Lamprocystis sp. TaxID=543132 RepID=UPI0025F42F6E|nr:hypothetical protein [uncultured Lamprocystis sp.]